VSDKKKVAVLGGGAGALSAALALTDPSREDRYDVTVYTLGWRLGGKGASGRNAEFGQRIEEHGIHVWFGFYDNAFRLLDGCYKQLAKKGWRTPEGRDVRLNHCVARAPNDDRAAFHPHESFVVNEQRRETGEWSKWRLLVPRNESEPGDGKPVLPEASLAFVKLAEMLQSILDIRSERTREGLEASPPPPDPLPPETPEEAEFRRFVEGRVQPVKEGAVPLTPEDFLRQALDGLAAPALENALSTSKEAFLDADSRFRLRLRFVAWSLRRARGLIRAWRGTSEKAHRLFLACDTFAAIATGISKDVFGADGDPDKNLDALDDLELRDWLATHGADPDYLLSNPTVRFIYNSAFAFVDGNHLTPSIAAGSALRGVLRLFLTYKGAFAYRMAAGMGDVVFSPIYQALLDRGVKFKFFHRVDGLGLADVDGRPVVDEIRVAEQVRLAGAAYDPFVWVRDFPCWPDRPRFEQIADGAALREAVEKDGLNLEDPGARWQGEAAHTLKRGEDFDEVVLGIPVEALKPIAGELRDHSTLGEAWTGMLDKTATTPTQAFQIWSRASLRDLGWNDPAPIFGTYVEPIDTYIDMTPALLLEEQRADDVKALSYFCGVFDRQAGETHEESMRRSVDNAIEHLVERSYYIWSAVRAGTDFQWTLMWGARKGKTARENFLAGQFARANVLPSELYTLNRPGTLRYRLRPDAAADGGAPANLWLAGDWTRNPINLGCVEATVMSGLAAARGLSGSDIEIVGERDAYLWQSFGRGTRTLSGAEALSPTLSAEDTSLAMTPEADLARFKDAVDAFDRPAVEALSAGLVRRLAGEGPAVTEDLAIGVLATLRRKRHFDLMQRVADAAIQAGIDAPKIRRQYAQALIDQGSLTAPLAVLQDVAAPSNPDRKERAEGLGLIGRVHKQRYVNAPRAPRSVESLRAAIESYHSGYLLGTEESGWHAVNTVALLQRARRDGIGLGNAFAALNEAELAQAALDAVGEKPTKKLTAWDRAIQAEAWLALGDPARAFAFLKQYAADDQVDAFEVNSTLRQLQEVWQLTVGTEPGAAILPFLEAQLLHREGGGVELSGRQIQNARAHLQKILGSEIPVTLGWYRTGLERCRLVARVSNQYEQGGGTGFLVRAGDLISSCAFADELVLLTNAHVLEPVPTEPGTLSPHQALVRFEAVSEPPPIHRVREVVWTSPYADIDATIARLDPSPTGFAACPIAPANPPPRQGSRVYVIGHPQGGKLSLSLYDNLLIDRDDKVLHYRAPTEPGSSGSPVFDADWNLVGLHHAGDLNMLRLNGNPGRYPANEGIWIEAIRKALGTVTPGFARS
jgi:uncharacterized protein with NAD-binding domain and iron-sulfur cluster